MSLGETDNNVLGCLRHKHNISGTITAGHKALERVLSRREYHLQSENKDGSRAANVRILQLYGRTIKWYWSLTVVILSPDCISVDVDNGIVLEGRKNVI